MYAIHKQDGKEAWALFERIHTEDLVYLRSLSRLHWSLLLKLVSGSVKDNKECWKRTEMIFSSMLRAGHEPSNQELARIIKVASRAGLVDAVMQIWNNINSANVPRNIELWNAYLRATCNADETMWYRRFNSSPKRRLPQEPPCVNDPLKIVSDILADGLSPDATTYELVILSLGQHGDLDYTSATISAVWGIKLESAPIDDDHQPVRQGSPVYPRISSLVAIINAYGANDALVDGLKVMEKMQALYHIPISGDYALLLWESIMKWSFYSTVPWGNTPESTLDAVWNAVEKNGIAPSPKMFYYKTRRELSLDNFNAMLDLIPEILGSRNVKHPFTLARSVLHQATLGLIRVGRIDEAHYVMDKWAEVNPAFGHFRERMLKHTLKHRAYIKQPSALALHRQAVREGTLPIR